VAARIAVLFLLRHDGNSQHGGSTLNLSLVVVYSGAQKSWSRRKKRSSRAKMKCRGKSNEISVGVDDRSSVYYDPRMTDNPMIPPLESNDKGRIGASAREHTIKQQAALKAIAIGQTHEFAQSHDTRHQSPFGLTIARNDWRIPHPLHEPPQRYELLGEAKQHVNRE
jgi:hypothetical protein